MLAAPSYRIAAIEFLLTRVGFRITCVPLFHIIYSPPLTTRNNIAGWTGQPGHPDEALRRFEQLLPDLERVERSAAA